MKPRIVLAVVAALALVLIPSAAFAQSPERRGGEESLALQVNSPRRIGPSETVSVAVVVNGDAAVEGTVRDALVVVNGNADVTGTVGQHVTVVNGELKVGPRGRVDGGVTLVDSTLVKADGASVAGPVETRDRMDFDWRPSVFSVFLFWLSTTVLTLGAALLFAAVGGRQLTDAGDALVVRPGGSLVAALVVWLGIPALALLLLVTIIGIPVSVALVLALPVLCLLGYLVAATRLGAFVLSRFGREVNPEHPYLAALTGVLMLRAVELIPFLGATICVIAGLIGAGALALVAWRAWRGPGAAIDLTPSPAPAM